MSGLMYALMALGGLGQGLERGLQRTWTKRQQDEMRAAETIQRLRREQEDKRRWEAMMQWRQEQADQARVDAIANRARDDARYQDTLDWRQQQSDWRREDQQGAAAFRQQQHADLQAHRAAQLDQGQQRIDAYRGGAEQTLINLPNQAAAEERLWRQKTSRDTWQQANSASQLFRFQRNLMNTIAQVERENPQAAGTIVHQLAQGVHLEGIVRALSPNLSRISQASIQAALIGLKDLGGNDTERELQTLLNLQFNPALPVADNLEGLAKRMHMQVRQADSLQRHWSDQMGFDGSPFEGTELGNALLMYRDSRARSRARPPARPPGPSASPGRMRPTPAAPAQPLSPHHPRTPRGSMPGARRVYRLPELVTPSWSPEDDYYGP